MKIFTKPSAQAEVMIQWDPFACMAIVYVSAIRKSFPSKGIGLLDDIGNLSDDTIT